MVELATLVLALSVVMVGALLVYGLYELFIFVTIKGSKTYDAIYTMIKQKKRFLLKRSRRYRSLSAFSNNTTAEKTLEFVVDEFPTESIEKKVHDFSALQDRIDTALLELEGDEIIKRRLSKINGKISEPKISVLHSYTSPQGRSSRSESIRVSFVDALDHINSKTRMSQFAKSERSKMTAQLRQQVLKKNNYTCQDCGFRNNEGIGLHVDHIHPISKGGGTVLENLQVLCSKCNGRKGNKVK